MVKPFSGLIDIRIFLARKNGSKGKIIEPCPETSPALKRIFELRAQGYSFDSIRHTIVHEEKLLPSKSIKQFRYKSKIESIIKNSFYGGSFEWDGQLYKGKHEIVVPPHIFKRAIVVGKNPTLRLNQKMGVLSNWLNCSCGCKTTYDPKTKTMKNTGQQKTYYYYRCSNGKKVQT